jgi:carboxyl-terminal processing protease
MKKIYLLKLFIPVTLLAVLLLVFAKPSFSQSNSVMRLFSNEKDNSNYVTFFKDVVARVKRDYVEQVTDKELVETALDGMLTSLDPHSSFFNEKDYKDVKVSTSGEFGGLGIEVTMEHGFIKVITPYDGSPAKKAGVMVGDYITTVNGEVIKGMKSSEAVEKLRGAPGTVVNVTVYRPVTGQTMKMTIKREIINIAPVTSKIVAEDVAYIRIPTFNEKVSSQVKKEIDKLFSNPKKEIRGMVLDLRWNPGGLFEQALEVTDLFLDSGDIVKIKGRNPKDVQIYSASTGDIIYGLPIVVIINNGSASAPEIVAGALQDNKRAVIIGEKSFGKGSVQTIIPLSGGTAMKLTTARYYTPSGKSIQAEGILPDILVQDAVIKPIDKSNVIYDSESSLKNHLLNDNKSKASSQNEDNEVLQESKFESDFQLLRAIDLVKGMALYTETFSE